MRHVDFMTATSATSTATSAPASYRLSRRQYDRMVEAGVLREDDHVELLEGVIYRMSPQGAPHSYVTRQLMRHLFGSLGDRAAMLVQMPFAASDDSEPEPDLAVIWTEDDLPDTHPSRAHLIVEVANSSQAYDLGIKARVYARAGVPQYWVVDLRARVVHEHRGPTDEGYTEVIARVPGEVLVVDAFPDVTVPVDLLLP